MKRLNIKNESVCAYMQIAQVARIDSGGKHKEPDHICIVLEEAETAEASMILTSSQARCLAKQLKTMADTIDKETPKPNGNKRFKS